MNKNLHQNIQRYIASHIHEVTDLICTIASIPSPTGHTEKKAAWVLQYLKNLGIDEAYIDEAGNVIYPHALSQTEKFPIYNAHIDTVFNQLDTITPRIDGNTLAAPSCGDNSASAAGLLFFIQMIRDLHITLPTGILFAFNVGEEGLGNLSGMRHIMAKWKDRTAEVVAVDCTFDTAVNLAVGSRRYAVTIDAEGGHSWMHFGNDNAIAIASSIISRLYAMTVPQQPRTTYNVGTIAGGTTVNSIAAQATFTLDLRSESMHELETLDETVKKILQDTKTDTIHITQQLLGERPCSNGVLKAELYDRYKAVRDAQGLPTVWQSGSTDANIPLHLGIPAISFGICRSHGEHTVHETLELDTIAPGLQQMADFMFFSII